MWFTPPLYSSYSRDHYCMVPSKRQEYLPKSRNNSTVPYYTHLLTVLTSPTPLCHPGYGGLVTIIVRWSHLLMGPRFSAAISGGCQWYHAPSSGSSRSLKVVCPQNCTLRATAWCTNTTNAIVYYRNHTPYTPPARYVH